MLPSELFRMAFDSTQDKNTTTCSNNVAENDYVDIVWENGQALMSSRTRRFHCSKYRDHMGTKYRKFGTMEHEFGAPWFDDSSQHEQHCSEFVSGVTADTHNLSPSLGTRSSVRDRDLVQHSRGLVSMNFPQFSLPAALVKASLENRVKETSPDDALKDDKKCDKVCEKGALGAACSSVCSGSDSIERSSDCDLKRKSEDSEWPSEDEEGSMDVKREVRAKRRRVARVHNLSEKVRRDRIKEKMRALQELIPNCNKVDKASLLDEAIEYVKTLQLQLQVMSKMSMGAGLYAGPSMMLPPTVQPFSMVGMGMNYGMPNMIGGCPMIQVPQMQNTHFPASPMFGTSAMHFDPPCH